MPTPAGQSKRKKTATPLFQGNSLSTFPRPTEKEEIEHQKFGRAGFEGVVAKVAELEKSLGIYDLASFTPAPSQIAK